MSSGFIPQAEPRLRVERYRAEIDAAVTSVLSGPSYILGAAVEAFEDAFAIHAKVPFCVGVGSGTDAIALALRALGVTSGDEVIVPALTFAGTAQAALHCGATPRFADVDPVSRCLDPAAAEAAITARTAAIVPVHLFGEPCDMPRLVEIAERHGLALVEDCAQSHGATLDGVPLGSFGDAAAYSFYPTKNLGGVGDGGAVATRRRDVADKVRRLRNYGFDGSQRISGTIGFNSRLDELQAAILSVLLPHLDTANAERRAIASTYRRGLQACPAIGLPPDSAGSVYHQFAITHPERDALAAALKAAGIGSAVHYTPALHRHPAFAAAGQWPCPASDQLAATLLSLPIQPEVAADAVDRIVRAIVGLAMAA